MDQVLVPIVASSSATRAANRGGLLRGRQLRELLRPLGLGLCSRCRLFVTRERLALLLQGG
jgi:hypothetical protein